MYCTCIGRKASGYTVAILDDKPQWEFWVCSSCHKPTKMVFEKLTRNRVPLGATSLLSYAGRTDGIAELRFACTGGERKTILTVIPYDRRPHSMGINPNDILLETWNRLDYYTDLALNHPEMPGSKHAARAVAEVLALMMPPFFNNADDIVREAVRRYNNCDNPDYETPGLGIKSLSVHDTMPYADKPPVKITLDERTQEAIKKALEMKLMTAQQLAKSYNVSVEEIRAIEVGA